MENTGSTGTNHTLNDLEEGRYVFRVKAHTGDGLTPNSWYLDVDTPADPGPLAGLTPVDALHQSAPATLTAGASVSLGRPVRWR